MLKNEQKKSRIQASCYKQVLTVFQNILALLTLIFFQKQCKVEHLKEPLAS